MTRVGTGIVVGMMVMALAGRVEAQGTELLALGTFAPLAPADAVRSDAVTAVATAAYAGRNADGVPHYVRRQFTMEERALLRRVFGIEEPGRLYLSDSLPDAALVYDTSYDRGRRHLVGSHRVGAVSVRRPGESWEELERRLAAAEPGGFPRSVARADTTLAALDSAVRPHFARLLADARSAGFTVKVVETRRSPERQAYLITLSQHLTHTATSRHSDGYAIDAIVDDGNLRRRRTRERWVAFRQWVSEYDGGRFRIIGTPGDSWDWPHIELNRGRPGFRSIEELLAAARREDGAVGR
jgi:hypothetical protein